VSASKVGARPAPARALFPGDEVRDAISRRSGALNARKRLADAVNALALDICGDPERMTLSERTWLSQALSGPVNEATEEALRVLVNELSAMLRTAPGSVRPAIVAPPRVSRTDFE
jgi:hypothetical protein